MVVVLGVLAFVTVLAILAFTLGQQALVESGNTQRQSVAFQVANAGLDAALANVQYNGLPTEGTVLTGNVEGLGSYVVTLSPQPVSECLAVSRGTSLDGAHEVIQTKFFYMNLWEFSIGSGSMTAGGGGVTGTGNIYGPLYVLGSIQLSGGANIERGPLFVKSGDISLSGDSHIGTPTDKIRLFCERIYPPDAGDSTDKGGHYAYVSSSVPKITLPPIDLTYLNYVYGKAKAESYDNKMGAKTGAAVNIEATGNDASTYTSIDPGGSPIGARVKAPGASTYYKVIGADAGPTSVWAGPYTGTPRTGALVLGGSDSFGKWAYPNSANPTPVVNDDFAYDGATKTLYLNGTIFIDHDVVFSGGPVSYVGNGTIVANGDVFVGCAVHPKDGFSASVGSGEALGIVTPGKIHLNINPPNGNPKVLTEYPDFAGALFGQEQVSFATNQQVRGSVLSKELNFSANNVHLYMNEALPTYLPDSLPGRGMAYIMKGNISRP